MADPDHRNIPATLWRAISDQDALRIRCRTVGVPCRPCRLRPVGWADVKLFAVLGPEVLAGNVSGKFQKTEPFAGSSPEAEGAMLLRSGGRRW
jgi:hypothetical protein